MTYLRIRMSEPVSSGSSVFIDECSLVPMTQLYTGGPSVAAFTGRTYWSTTDTFTITVSNNRASDMHEWANRIFALRDNDLLLPSNVAALETIDDVTYFV